MLARIEQVTTTPEGALALFATYWQDGQQVNAQRHALMMPVQSLTPYRNGDGLRERLDGVAVANVPTTQDAILAEQIGLKMVAVETSGQAIADRAVTAVKSFAATHAMAATLQAQTASATDQQLLAMAAGRVIRWGQVAEMMSANGDTQGEQHALARKALAEQAAENAAIARQLAEAEIAPMVALLTNETPWPAGESDPRGYLKPEVMALVGTEWECE